MPGAESLRFDFASPGRISFGPGVIGTLANEASALGSLALFVTGRDPQRHRPVLESLLSKGLIAEVLPVDREPTVDMVRRGTQLAESASVNLVIGVGGGSVMDAAKAIAALLANGGDPLDYLEVVGAGQPLARPAIPLILAPTTAGTGTEATKNAVLLSEEHRVKVSLRSLGLLPRLALIDPELTYGLPPEVTAMGGLDALTQLIEPFVGRSPQPITDALCLDGMRRISRSLRPAYSEGSNAAARADLALAALFSGIALANAGLGVVHGFAGVIGGMTEAHHGVVCASLLPAGMLANLTALRARAPDHPSLPRFTDLAIALTGREPAEAEEGIAWVAQLARDLGIPRLSQLGLEERDVDLLVERTAVASSTKGNPIVLTPEELKGIVRASW